VSPKANSSSNGNRLLASLGPGDIDLLRPDLEPRELQINQVIEEPNRPIRHVCFPDAGILSVVASFNGDRGIEIGLIGREGVSGGAVALGNDRSPHKTYVQVAGTGHRITAEKFRRALNASEAFRMLMMKSVAAFNVQTAHTAVANGRAHLEERLARWLLMAHDRIDGDEVALTHEFLSLMLAVRRSGVTTALQEFVRKGHIKTGRGVITILDRAALEEVANSYYGVPESELRRLMGEVRQGA
jgi:CRP-like cAMP-binding protein